jgi:hypothetical protein
VLADELGLELGEILLDCEPEILAEGLELALADVDELPEASSFFK